MSSRINIWVKFPGQALPHRTIVRSIRIIIRPQAALHTSGVHHASGVYPNHKLSQLYASLAAQTAGLRSFLGRLLPSYRWSWPEEQPAKSERMRLPDRLLHESKQVYPFNGLF